MHSFSLLGILLSFFRAARLVWVYIIYMCVCVCGLRFSWHICNTFYFFRFCFIFIVRLPSVKYTHLSLLNAVIPLSLVYLVVKLMAILLFFTKHGKEFIDKKRAEVAKKKNYNCIMTINCGLVRCIAK